MEVKVQTFRQFLPTAFDQGQYTTDDVIAFLIPLFKEVLSFHETDLVAPFEREDSLFITGLSLDIDEHYAFPPKQNIENVLALFSKRSSRYVDIVESLKVDTDVDGGIQTIENLNIHLNENEPVVFPAYLRGYKSYEFLAGHHDAQSDIFCLGLILGSISLGLDLYQEDELRRFVDYRSNASKLNAKIHPTVSTLIREMTELDRSKRIQDLYEIIDRLEHYRDFDPERQIDLSNVTGWINKELSNKSQFILNKLRNRLFDLSHRNRLLYYKPNARFINLTLSSVPMVLHYQSIRPELLFTWNEEIAERVKGMKEIVLNKYLRFEGHQYLPSSLDKIRVEAQRDINEYGFSQLKMVIAFLNWHNLRENKDERIQSPLLLIPVELKKTKKLKEDHYYVKVLDNEAEVNPVLSNYLRELYGIKLPDFIDLDDISVHEFYQQVKNQIDSANQEITLNLVEKPRIKLIHSVAKQTVTNYKKKLRVKDNQLNSYKNIPYSYQQEQYKPLGLEIFHQYVEPRATLLEFLINDDIKLSSNQLKEQGKEREIYELAESENNPYQWDFDICNVVLGNFNYKKMSLVRDYNQVIDSQLNHSVFENLFSSDPKPVRDIKYNPNSLDDWYHVITADPTQTKAILQSRSGESYIIQGPPGTGKSQTITNLIADFVAQGKSVLFVCEKRAALDVVYYRLKQQGLEELCCYIHDSQGDKRTFIQNLKSTYEDFIKNRMDLKAIHIKRTEVLGKMQEQLLNIKCFHESNDCRTDTSGIEIRKLIEKIIELNKNILVLEPKDEEILPHYSDWLKFGATINELSRALEETGSEASFADHSFSKIREDIFNADNPTLLLEEKLRNAQKDLQVISEFVFQNKIFNNESASFDRIKKLVQEALVFLPLAENNILKLVDKKEPQAQQFDQSIREYKQELQSFEALQKLNENWKSKFSEQDTLNALALAEKHESSFFSFINGSWRALKKQLHEYYDFSMHHVQPSYRSILQHLKDEHEGRKFIHHKKQKLQQQYGIVEIDETIQTVHQARIKIDNMDLLALLNNPMAEKLVIQLSRLKTIVERADRDLNDCLLDYQQKDLNELQDDMESILINIDGLPELIPALRKYASLPDHIKYSLSRLSLTPVEAEVNMAHKSLNSYYKQNKKYNVTDLAQIERSIEDIEVCYKQLLKLNAQYIRGIIRQRFLSHIELSNIAPSQLNTDQKILKKNYNEGRKILENEFSKSMRYKSIRELASKESGLVLRDLKPVWLMSPLSVSDSLPLNINYFDAIIFDEASQITLEEGIPSLYRAPQTIIVGDDKQMPPSNFFTAKAEDPDDLEALFDDEDDEILSNDADSLLVQGARKLNSVMLGWHYRSRYETLISYSNHAFYNAGLLTIPDKTVHHNEKASIEVSKPEDGAIHADYIFDRSISFHYHPSSIYEKRTNLDEANYIAHLVRELLKRDIEESIGIVAFSQEQQHTIEDALTHLTLDDKDFEQRLEKAYERTEEDQFVGLFIKNLENVQGDERDIIIMSVCYGFDSRKKMIMNFGPINKKGGEKRLNVIFSRAKKHMAIVSSIKHLNITNEYNEGANYFKRFLQYAELVSIGNTEMARTILDGLVVERVDKIVKPESSVILKQIGDELRKLGYEVAEHVGQSKFKCSLAVKLNKTDKDYTLSILLDDDTHYSNMNLLEQYYQRPGVLKSFGWKTIQIFAKDWLHQKEKVVKQIIKRLKEEPKNLILPDLDFTTASSSQEVIQLEIEEESQLPIDKEAAAATPYDHLSYTRLIFNDEMSNKFWEAATEENKLIVKFGRIGTKGQVQVKTFNSTELATLEKEKLVKEKISKGYSL